MSLQKEKDRRALAAAAVNNIIEVKNPYQDVIAASRSNEQRLEELQYKERLEEQREEIETAEQQKRNVARSRTEDILHSKGWSRFPRPNERYFDLNVNCPYQCESKVALLKSNSPNINGEDYPLGTPLSMDHVDSYGNHTQLHSCILNIKKNSELQYLVRRIEHLQNQNKILNNALNKHAQDSTLHKGLFH